MKILQYTDPTNETLRERREDGDLRGQLKTLNFALASVT